MRARLTEAIIDAIEPSNRDQYVFDIQLATFVYRLTPAGKGIFLVGKRPRRTVGHRPMKVAEAREKATQILVDLKAGRDPAVAQQVRETARKAGVMTVTELSKKWMADYVRPKLKPRTIADYERLLDQWILPALGQLTVAEVSLDDVNRMHVAMAKTPRRANYTLRTTSGLFRFARDRRLRSDNPCQGIRPYREGRRERFLSEAEIARAAEAITEAEREGGIGPWAAAGLRLCLLTGARQGEILATKWSDVHWDRRMIRLSDSKTNDPRTIHLSDAALQVLRSIPRIEPYVIAGAKPHEALKNLSRAWIVARAKRGLDDVRLHDLRHSFASLAIARGISLKMIGTLLGHRRESTTNRYAHLAQTAAAAVNDEVADAIVAAIETGAPTATNNITKLRQNKREQTHKPGTSDETAQTKSAARHEG
jgi:integrase